MENMKQRDVFFEIGHIEPENRNWRVKLRGLSNGEVDCETVEKYCRKQFEKQQDIFFDYWMKPSSINQAEYLILRTGITFSNTGDEILVQYQRGKKYGNWVGIKFVKHGGSQRMQRSKGLYGFAFLDGDWTETLAKKAAPEIWTLKTSKRENDVLFKFLSFTFERLEQDGQIVESKDCAAFHTGLYTANYNPVFAYFIQNPRPNMQRWKLKDFLSPNEGALGKEMSRRLNLAHAKPANWFKDPSRLYCNPELLAPGKLDINIEHCVVDNAYRLPRELVEKAAYGNATVKAALNATYSDELVEREAIASSIRSSQDFIDIQDALKVKLISAIELACKKIRCDYATAVPQYYPEHEEDNDGFGYLVPLAFNPSRPDHIDCALVVQPTSDGRGYRAATLLTPDMAYSNARLLRRPDAHWLTEQLKSDLQ